MTLDELDVVIESLRLQAEAKAARKAADRELANTLEWDWAWLDDHCLGDGFDRHPLLAAPGPLVRERSVSISGEIRDGRGHHPAATFSWEARK